MVNAIQYSVVLDFELLFPFSLLQPSIYRAMSVFLSLFYAAEEDDGCWY